VFEIIEQGLASITIETLEEEICLQELQKEVNQLMANLTETGFQIDFKVDDKTH